MILIPLEMLLAIWVMAAVVSGAAAFTSFRSNRYSMAMSLMAFAAGAVGMISFYIALLYAPFRSDYAIMIPWSRFSVGINGLMILGGSIAALIVTKGKPG